MGTALALLSMVCFATNILLTRYAMARLGVQAGFLIVLATNTLFPAALFALELGVRAAPFVWNWKAAGLFAIGGVIGMIVGRRMLFDAVRLLGPSRASVFHSTAPAFALIGAWLLAGEQLGIYEIVLMAVVWVGLWFTQPRPGAGIHAPDSQIARKGMIAGLVAVAGFGFGNVFRGLAMRVWNEALLGAAIASLVALACQLLATRGWPGIANALRKANRVALALYLGCWIATSLGAIFITYAMLHLEIALAVLIVHTTPLVIFPVSVFVLKHREELSPRTLAGAAMVLAGIALLAVR